MEEVKQEVATQEARGVATPKEDKKVKFSEALENEFKKYGEALPLETRKEQQAFIMDCTTLLNENPKLAEYGVKQVILGLMKGAMLGLNFYRKDCYLIPYGRTLNFQTDYKGDIKVVRRYAKRPVKDIYAKVVREGENFKSGMDGQNSFLIHDENPFSNGKVVGAYAVVKYEDGGMEYETMSTEELEQVRNAFSKSKDSVAWKNTPTEMYKKTVLRRLCKHITVDLSNSYQYSAWEESSDSSFKQVAQDKVKVIDITKEEE